MLELSFSTRPPLLCLLANKMTDADMVDAPVSTADAAAATASAAAKALAKGKAPAAAAASASSADALARAAATAASAPWVEKYRPNTLDDVASHGEIIETSESGKGEKEKERRFDGIKKTIEPSRKAALSQPQPPFKKLIH